MRTKALLGLAVLAVSASTLLAQSNVYSLNVVGYHNVTLNPNAKMMIANQLNAPTNTLMALISGVPSGSQFFKYAGGFTGFTYGPDDFGNMVWDGDTSLAPGEGGFFVSPAATTITFVGEVLQGSLTNPVPANVKVIRSSMVPQAGGITTVLGLPAESGDQAFTWNGGYTGYTFGPDDFGNLVWDVEPNVAVGQAFFYKKAAAGTNTQWIRNFTVGP